MMAVARRGNLESWAQNQQLRVGLVALAMSLMVATLLAREDLATGYRAFAFLPFLVAAYGLLAAFYRTCGITALVGKRATSEGTEPVADRQELSSLRARGVKVMLGSVMLAAGATSLLLVAS